MLFDNKNKKTGITRILSASKNTNKGLIWMAQNETAFKQEIWLLIVLAPVTFWLDVSPLEQALLISSLLFIILTETLNTALEAVVDRIGLELHELSGLAKDLGSAAVFISFVIAICIWLGVLCN